MKKEEFIFSFGCPRSGTTFMQSVFIKQGKFNYQKLSEASALHPWKSSDGLINLRFTLFSYNVLFIRTVRSPIEVFNSFYAAKGIDGFSGKGIANNSDERIYKYILNESDNFYYQVKRAEELFKGLNINFNYINVKYEDLYRDDYKEEFLNKIYNFIGSQPSFLEKRINNFGKKSVREGRMSHNVTKKDFISDEKNDEIKKKCERVFKREGYKI